ncbi:GNAT family N-acetyltransferase [Holdemania massiliensis]|uniref:GNAT family N-acetyltransferase n=1 Tax=Holdemania massiliensis TaxID=1468449 RepID=UPI001F0530A9|nr:GNAT family N-acetyltransferase [Holdemania massiliensis]MCH1939810.1 GNAT family N-acetyltransferase [Holdemania massiliensis]
MQMDFVTLTLDNLETEHLSCIIRSKKPHPGVEAKRQWLADRIPEGHIFRKLNVKEAVFIEYAPLETAWVPILGDNYLYLYCLWVSGSYKGQGIGQALLESCLADAERQGKSGVCMLGSQKQKAWLSDQSFVKKFNFKIVDQTENGYDLLALSFDKTLPRFAANVKLMQIENQELTLFYDYQCPFITQYIETIRKECEANSIPLSLNPIDSVEKAKSLPCVFNNWACFYKGHFETVNLLNLDALKRILRKG